MILSDICCVKSGFSGTVFLIFFSCFVKHRFELSHHIIRIGVDPYL